MWFDFSIVSLFIGNKDKQCCEVWLKLYFQWSVAFINSKLKPFLGIFSNILLNILEPSESSWTFPRMSLNNDGIFSGISFNILQHFSEYSLRFSGILK